MPGISSYKTQREIPRRETRVKFCPLNLRAKFYDGFVYRNFASIIKFAAKFDVKFQIMEFRAKFDAAPAKALIRAGALAVHHRLDRGVVRQLLAIDLLDLFPQLARSLFVALRA